MHGKIILKPLVRTTPTIWSQMRLCTLRGALASNREVESWVLHDPRQWLGTAFHKVMEVADRVETGSEDAEHAWEAAVKQAAEAAALHPLDARYADPDRWPGYYLVRQRALASARSVNAERTPRPRARRGAGSGGARRLLEGRGGRLCGRPDHFGAGILTEYKSTLPDSAWPGSSDVIEGFRRQLRLYAVLVAEVFGSWPMRGRVLAANGQTIDVPLVKTECEAEAESAIAALNLLNGQITFGSVPDALATPSPSSCRSCPFQCICPAFWMWLKGGGRFTESDDVAMEGVLNRVELGQDRDLYIAYFEASAASHSAVKMQSLVLRRSIHRDLTTSPEGATWRVVGAKLRPDGRIRADLSTVVFDADELPMLVSCAALDSVPDK